MTGSLRSELNCPNQEWFALESSSEARIASISEEKMEIKITLKYPWLLQIKEC